MIRTNNTTSNLQHRFIFFYFTNQNATNHSLRAPCSGSLIQTHSTCLLLMAHSTPQGYHNLSADNCVILDPLLTRHGETQCADLSNAFPSHSKISLVFASPLRRTLDTARLAFMPALNNRHCKTEIIALPEAQETSDFPSDTGSAPEVLRRWCEENQWPVDRELVTEGWDDKGWDGRWAPSAEAISARAREARRFIRKQIGEVQERQGRKDVEVVLVTHGGFLHYFTEDWEDSGLYSGESCPLVSPPSFSSFPLRFCSLLVLVF